MTWLYIMELPEHKIMLYVAHPVADLFKQSFTRELDFVEEDRSNVFQARWVNNTSYNESDDEYWDEICYGCDTRIKYEGYCRVVICCNELYFSSFRIIDLSLIFR